jgi:hypothetical protein
MLGELGRLAEGVGRDLHTLQIKLTYVGPQLKGTPSVAFTTFHHLLQMDWFIPLRRPHLSYGNDEGDVLNFTVAPEEMTRIVRILADLEAVRAPSEATSPQLSLMLVLKKSRLGETAYEAVVDADEAQNVNRVIRDALDEGNLIGRKVMDLQGANR